MMGNGGFLVEKPRQDSIDHPGPRVARTSSYLPIIDDAELARRNQAAIRLLEAWMQDEDEEEEQEETMTIESLERARKAQPFRPFWFRLADGRSIPVPHPEFLAYNGKSRIAVVTDEGDGFEVIDLLLVVSLSFEGEPASKP